MTRHLDQADMLEVLYLDETTDDRSTHLGTCIPCHDRFTALRAELEEDREAIEARVASKPDSFWTGQRDEIVARATHSRRGAFGFLRFRPAFSILMAILLLATAMVMLRTAQHGTTAQTPTDVAVRSTSDELFEEEDLRALDPWETDELESFRQIVEWEEWIDDDRSTQATSEEES